MFLTKKKVIKAIFSLILVFICSSNYSAQNNTVPVELKLQEQLKPIIKSGETHNYQIKLQKGETAKINLLKINIDFITSIYNSEGNVIIEIDGKNSRVWKKTLTVLADKDSIFRISVKALGVADISRNYSIQMVEKRNTLPIDEKSQLAEKTFAEAQKLTTNRASLNQAIEKFNEVITLSKELNNKSLESVALVNLGITFQDLGKNEESFPFFISSIELLEGLKDKLGEAFAIHSLGVSHYFLGDFTNAITYFSASLKIREEIQDLSGMGASLNNLGIIYRILSENNKAKEYFENSLQIQKQLKNKLSESIVLMNIGLIYYDLSQYELALTYFANSLSIKKELNDKRGESDVLQNIALVKVDLSQFAESLSHYQEALKIRREMNNKLGEAETINGIGTIFYTLGKFEDAKKYYLQSLEIFQNLKSKRNEALNLGTLGEVYFSLNDLQQSVKYFEQSNLIFTQLNDKKNESITLNYIGDLQNKLNLPLKAIEYLEKALKNHQEIGYKLGESSVSNSLGESYLLLSEFNKANQYFGKALIIAREINTPQLEIDSQTNLMKLWQKNKQPNLAIFYGKQAVNILQQIRADIKGLDANLQKSFLQNKEYTYRQLADLLISQGRFREAQQVLEMLKETEYFEFIRRDKTEIEKLSKRADLTEKEKTALENYLKLADKITLLGQELQSLEDKQSKLPANQNLSDTEKNRINELKGLLKIAEDAFQLFLEKDLVAQLSSENIKGLEFDKSLQNELKNFGKGTISIYTVVTNDRYRAIVTTPFSQTDGKTEINLTELNKKIFTFRSALTDPKSDPKVLAKELYDILIKPIEKDLEGAKAKTIIWSLDGTLRYIPISALWDGKQYLLEKYQNIVLTSSTKTNIRQQNKVDWNILAGGVSDAQEVKPPLSDEKIKFSSLPQVKNELQSIVLDNVSNSTASKKGLLQGKVLLDNDFTPQSLTTSIQEKQGIGTRKYNLIHLASHFWLGNNTTDSFLLLGNGKYVTLEEIKKSPEFDLTNVELVTLSACNTGFNGGTGAEVDSLATLLESRGAKATLSSLWAVADESTSNLMVEFYRARKNNPKINKSEALRQAQIKLLKDKTGKFSHPFYWSPFVMVGNWR